MLLECFNTALLHHSEREKGKFLYSCRKTENFIKNAFPLPVAYLTVFSFGGEYTVIVKNTAETVYIFFKIVYNSKSKGDETMRLWAKLMKDGHICKQYVYENTEKLTYSHFFDYLTDICSELDIPTPVLLKTHIFNFAKFNRVKFLPRDFVDGIEYDQFFIENLH